MFKNNEISIKILQNLGKYLQNFEELLMIFYKKYEKIFRKLWELLQKFLANIE